MKKKMKSICNGVKKVVAFPGRAAYMLLMMLIPGSGSLPPPGELHDIFHDDDDD